MPIITATLFSTSVLISCSPSRIPTASALKTECSLMFPNLCLSVLAVFRLTISTAAAPTLPPCAEPSVYTLYFSVKFLVETRCTHTHQVWRSCRARGRAGLDYMVITLHVH